MDGCPRHDIKMALGDFNAQVGQEKLYYPAIGGHSMHTASNDNGRRLINFAAAKDMVIGSTVFPHKRIHKATWRSPDGTTQNQIDHLLICARYKSSLLDVRSYRGANIDSDHYLVIAKVRAKISNVRQMHRQKTKRLNTAMFKTEAVKEKYMEELSNNLTTLSPGESVDEQWTNCVEAIDKAARSVIGYEQAHERNPWFDEQCQIITELKNKAYKRMLQVRSTRASKEEYKAWRRREKKVHRRKKRQWEKSGIQKIEELSSSKDTRRFFQKVNRVRTPFKSKLGPCRLVDGSLASSNEGILNRWAEFFEELMNGNMQEETSPREEYCEEIEPPEESEIIGKTEV